MEHLGSAAPAPAASSLRPHTPADASVGPLSSCGPNTCALGLAPDAWPPCRYRCNRMPALAASLAEARNNPAGRRAHAEEGFRCVTTRRAQPQSPTPNRHPPGACSGRHFAAAAAAPLPRVSHAPRAMPAGRVAAASPANDAPIAGIPALRSTAGSIAGHDTAAHTPGAGKSAIPAAGPQPGTRLQIGRLRWYPAPVPWEVATPRGRPGRMRLILLGHFTPAISSFSNPRRTANDFPKRSLYAAGRRKPARQTRCFPPARRRSTRREGNGEEHVPNASGKRRRRKKTIPPKKSREEHGGRKCEEGLRPKTDRTEGIPQPEIEGLSEPVVNLALISDIC